MALCANDGLKMRLGLLLIVLSALFALGPDKVRAGEVLESFPGEIDASERYVFYSHGFIVEGDDPRPVHPRWGAYLFPEIKAALANAGFTVIGYHRPAGTDPKAYAETLASQVRTLIAAGVPGGDITLVGFSRGGRITAYAAHGLANSPVNVVILAGCGGWVENEPDIVLSGDVLSVYEISDRVGSCARLRERSQHVKSFEEIAIGTGAEHGAFYTPRPEWLTPITDWINARR
ncbi:MAG: alpha/beta hydrolase [Pseudomonadota bacterium]